mmetsp:Transcript_44054/g.64736  ORF Transcript_44054/g.64736 Transcript_44054/m.64736 type:complete len:90 (+) Transcript_44054:1836-2105(+)
MSGRLEESKKKSWRKGERKRKLRAEEDEVGNAGCTTRMYPGSAKPNSLFFLGCALCRNVAHEYGSDRFFPFSLGELEYTIPKYERAAFK